MKRLSFLLLVILLGIMGGGIVCKAATAPEWIVGNFPTLDTSGNDKYYFGGKSFWGVSKTTDSKQWTLLYEGSHEISGLRSIGDVLRNCEDLNTMFSISEKSMIVPASRVYLWEGENKTNYFHILSDSFNLPQALVNYYQTYKQWYCINLAHSEDYYIHYLFYNGSINSMSGNWWGDFSDSTTKRTESCFDGEVIYGGGTSSSAFFGIDLNLTNVMKVKNFF